VGVIFIIGVAQAFFIEIILLNKKKKSLSDKILAAWIFIIGLHLLLYHLDFIQFYNQYPHILGLEAPLPLVHGPFMLMYVISLTSKEQRIRRLLLLHFIPALAFYLFMLPKLLLPADEKLYFAFEVMPANPPLYWVVFSFLVNISGPVYIIWSLWLLRKHYRAIRDSFSYVDEINLKWLRNIIIGMGLIWFAVIISNAIDEETGSNIVFIAVSVFIFLIGYYGTRQGIVFSDRKLVDLESVKEEKYKKSTLDNDRIQTIVDQLLNYMDEGKPYLESKITLPQLAEKLNTNSNYLSQAINEKLKMNFYDFINKYRVEEFKERLKSRNAANFTLFGHASDCGFSSKSSFNEVFKKITGITPSQYQASLLSDS
jgi:AraC-like DNA-binding protein